MTEEPRRVETQEGAIHEVATGQAVFYIHRGNHRTPNQGPLQGSVIASESGDIDIHSYVRALSPSNTAMLVDIFRSTVDARDLFRQNEASPDPRPLALIDMPLPLSIIRKEATQHITYIAASSLLTFAGLWAIKKAKETQINRRETIIAGAKAAAALGASMALPHWAAMLIRQVSDVRDKNSAAGVVMDWYSGLIQDQGFLEFVLGLRDLVIAEKAHRLAQHMAMTGKVSGVPKVDILVGLSHDIGLSRALLMTSEERMARIREVLTSAGNFDQEYFWDRDGAQKTVCALNTIVFLTPRKSELGVSYEGSKLYLDDGIANQCRSFE